MKSLSKLKVVKRLSVEEQKLIRGGGPAKCYMYEYSSGLVREERYFDDGQQGVAWCSGINNLSSYACCCSESGRDCYNRW